MDKIEAASTTELLKSLSAVDVSFPLRTEGRTKEHSERSSICHFLATFAETDLLDFPLRVEHIDRPDIVLFLPSVIIGIEITEAVPKDLARADVVAEEKEYENLRFLPCFRPGEPPRSRKEIDEIAKGESPGSVWEGDSAECEWAEVMVYFSQQKAKRFSNAGFKKYPKNWLLIYDNWPLPILDQHRGAAKFHNKLIGEGWTLPFDEIFVDWFQNIWRFNRQSYLSVPINDIWRET